MCTELDCKVEPWWLSLKIFGFEGEADDSSDDSDDSGDDSDTSDDSDDSDDTEESDDSDDSDEDDDAPVTQKDIKGLKSALTKERQARRKLERENKRLKKTATNGQAEDKKDDQPEDKGPSEKEIRLAARLKTQAVNQIIMSKAATMNFVDIDDVLSLINRDEIDVDQNEDDPSEVDVDVDSVVDALKDLAKRKKHLVKSSNGSAPKSGGKVGGKGGKNSDGLDDEALRNKYRALRR